jgi:electron transport complex protein RnfD
MRQVLYALVPGVAACAWFFGPGVLVQIALAVTFALALEAAMLGLRGRALGPFLGDGSAVVTAVLFALCIPPLAPWWISAVAMLFAIVVAKHLYGGLGQNLFNPAMVGYAVVLVSFPVEMTQWLTPRGLIDAPPGLGDSLAVIFFGATPPDAFSGATPLDALKTGLESGRTVPEIREAALFGALGGRGWEWIALAWAAGGAWLLWRRVVHWPVPTATLASALVLSTLFWLLDPAGQAPPQQHLAAGALVLGAFFIATDPVSGCASVRGRLIFGCGVALITLVIRRWGAYPDGVAFAVLLMNMSAPFIDRYTRPRVYGR